MIVTFLLLAGMVPGSTNCLHVIDEIQEIRSPRSVSGFMFSFTIRLLGGNFLQELNSFSPASSPVPETPLAGGVVAVVPAAPVGLPKIAGPPAAPGVPGTRLARRSCRGVSGCDGEAADGGLVATGAGTGAGWLGSGPTPETTAASANDGETEAERSPRMSHGAPAAARQFLGGLIGYCIPC